jgi:hypothetical protein
MDIITWFETFDGSYSKRKVNCPNEIPFFEYSFFAVILRLNCPYYR